MSIRKSYNGRPRADCALVWTLFIVCAINTFCGFFLLRESYGPVILARRRRKLENSSGSTYRIEGEDTRPVWDKTFHSLRRPLKILIQPIVLIMSTYQAIVFATTYSIYTNMQSIFSGEYGFDTEQVGLAYLGPGLGFLFAVSFLVPRIDTVWNHLRERNDGKARPEYRLPLANIGAVFIPCALFWFAWSVELHAPWLVSVAATFPYGIGQVMILNCTSNYYIDSFEKYAASALAAGAMLRSVVGGIAPIFASAIFDTLGYGWGISTFGFLALALAPAPSFFFYYGASLREKYQVEL